MALPAFRLLCIGAGDGTCCSLEGLDSQHAAAHATRNNSLDEFDAKVLSLFDARILAARTMDMDTSVAEATVPEESPELAELRRQTALLQAKLAEAVAFTTTVDAASVDALPEVAVPQGEELAGLVNAIAY